MNSFWKGYIVGWLVTLAVVIAGYVFMQLLV